MLETNDVSPNPYQFAADSVTGEAHMFQRLLVAIDDSERSDVTLSFATAMARQFSAAVHVLHVNEYVVGSRSVPLRTDDEATELVTEALEQLRSEGVKASGSVRRASYRQVARHIATSADEFSADALILGSRRHGRFGALFSARVRERTTRLTSLPVIAAPAPLELPSHGRLDVADIITVPPHQERTLSA
jgi:nucleotide-binding universal stress UspA family protein